MTSSLNFGHQLVIAPYQTRIGVRTNSAEMLDRVREILLPGWVEQPGGLVDFTWSLYQDESRTLAAFDEEILCESGDPVETLNTYLHIYIGDTARNRTFVHAGVVGWGGAGILLPGSTFAGKSTLTRALVDLGATFYSDDMAVLDERGWVWPYPKPLSLRKPGGVQLTGARALGWHPQLAPLPVRLIACLRFGEDGQAWSTVMGAQASFRLIEHCVSIRRQPARDMQNLIRTCSGAACYEGQRGEAKDAAGQLLHLLQQRLQHLEPPLL